MYIKKIHIQNYKGIKELTREFDSGVTIIIGNNGANKGRGRNEDKRIYKPCDKVSK